MMRTTFTLSILLVVSLLLCLSQKSILRGVSPDASASQAGWRFDIEEGKKIRSNVSINNICKEPHRFRIKSNIKYLSFAQSTDAILVGPASTAQIGIVFDATGLRRKAYHDTVIVECVDCKKERGCIQNRDELSVEMTVVEPTQPDKNVSMKQSDPDDDCNRDCHGRVWSWHPCTCIDVDGDTCPPQFGPAVSSVCRMNSAAISKDLKLELSTTVVRQQNLAAYASRLKHLIVTARAHGGPSELRAQADEKERRAKRSQAANLVRQVAQLRDIAQELELEGVVSDNPATPSDEKAESLRLLEDKAKQTQVRADHLNDVIKTLRMRLKN